MILDIAALVAGLVALVFAGDKLVTGAVGLAERLRISPLVIGLTIVAFGTSAPELFISMEAALSGKPALALGNVVGSNIANVLLVLGAPALLAVVRFHEPGITVANWMMVVLTGVFMVMLYSGEVGRVDGMVLFAALLGYLAFQGYAARAGRLPAPDYADEVETEGMTGRGIAIAIAIGLVGLPLGAHFTIVGATGVAAFFGVSDAVIGLTVVAIGTSLPELITSVMAAIRRSNEVAVGNVVGSNVFNLGAITGLTAMVVPLDVPQRMWAVDMWVMAAATALLVALSTLRASMARIGGAAMLIAYVAYMIALY